MKITLGIVAFLIVVGGVYAVYLKGGTIREQTVPSFVLQGKVTGVYPDKSEITIMKDSVERTVTIDSATRIKKILSQKNAEGTTEQQAVVEVDIGDIPKESLVIIEYQSEKDFVLGGVDSITFEINGDVDAYLKQTAPTNANMYVEGKVVSVNLEEKSIQYHPYTFSTIGAATMTIALPDGSAVYQVDDSSRIAITHARTAMTLADVKPGQTIFFVVAAKIFQKGKIVPEALIILEK